MIVQLEVLKKHKNDTMSYEDALTLVEKSGKHMPTNKEVDELIQSGEFQKYPDLFPCWTGTYVEYEKEDCTITENGKKTKIKLPLENGWYEQDEFGIPSGKPSVKENPNARYLDRLEKNSCHVGRAYHYIEDGDYKRTVNLDSNPSVSYGVAVVKANNKKSKK